MKTSDFQDLNITAVSPADVEETGASLDSVQAQTIATLQNVVDTIERPARLIKNGLTTGSHNAKEHAVGLAVDFYFINKVDKSEINQIIFAMIRAGFNGIGVYWNGNIFSFHGDLRATPVVWRGEKSGIEEQWKYTTIIFV